MATMHRHLSGCHDVYTTLYVQPRRMIPGTLIYSHEIPVRCCHVTKTGCWHFVVMNHLRSTYGWTFDDSQQSSVRLTQFYTVADGVGSFILLSLLNYKRIRVVVILYDLIVRRTTILCLFVQGTIFHALSLHVISTLINPRKGGVQKLNPLVLREYLSYPSEFSIALRRIPRAIKAWWNDVLIFEIVQPVIEIRHEVKVVRTNFWLKCDKLGDHGIKGCKSTLEANSTLLRLFLKMSKPPLLIANSPCAQFYLRSTGNQNGGHRTEKT